MCESIVQVKGILGSEFDQTLFDAQKDKDTNLLARDTLLAIVNSHNEQTVTDNEIETQEESTPTKIGIQLSGITKRNARVRHRSFENSDDQAQGQGGDGKRGHTKRIPRALSMEGGPPNSSDSKPPPAGGVDSWESVQAQPSCVICGMVFASMGKLDTHVKYSSVHVSNLKKLDTLEKSKSFKGSSIVDHQEIESARCRVMYSGNKHFWRTQDNLDITIYLHIDAKCLEVIAFEAKVNTEYPRLYLDETKILSMLTEEMVWQKVAAVEEAEGKKKFKKELPPRDILFAEEKRLCVSTFVLQRLKLCVDGTAPPMVRGISDGKLLHATEELLASQSAQMLSLGVSSPKGGGKGFGAKQINYVAEVTDAEKEVEFDLTKGTADVTPVLVARRRHSSDQEIKDQIHLVEEMQHDIQMMTQRAENIANKVHKGVENFNAKVRGRNERVSAHSKPRQRWVFAIKRVLRRAQVQHARKHLLTFGDKYYTLPPGREL